MKFLTLLASRLEARRRLVLLFAVPLVILVAVFLASAFAHARPSLSYPSIFIPKESFEHLEKVAAGNRTLGFSSIKYLNLPNRFDRLDALRIQAYVSGIDVEEYPGVIGSDLQDVGMPPSRNLQDLKPGEKGCWRAHANIWSEMVHKKLPPTLILESDAAWDVDLRKIMALFNENFTKLLRQLDSKPLYMDRTKNDEQESEDLHPDPEDPWHSDHWDIISLGNCYDSKKSPASFLKYDDSYVPGGTKYFGQPLGSERVVHQSGGFVCTGAYAITHRGAAKLLLRSAYDFSKPVDLLIGELISKGELVAYTTIPTIMAQWNYVKGIGMADRGANSDIQGTKFENIKEGAKPDMSGWDDVEKKKSAWEGKPGNPLVAFNRMALQVAWEQIFSKEKDVDST